MINRRTALTKAATLLIVAAGLLSAGCGGKTSAASPGVLGKDVKPISDTLLPPSLLGLSVGREDVTKALALGSRSYIDNSSVYSLRTPDNLLQATLQVSHFVESAKYQTTKFRQTVVSGVGGTRPRAVRVGDETVFLTTGNQQRISIWFHGRYLFILATRNDYDQPRTLLRKALELRL